jgi:hypothetical protein
MRTILTAKVFRVQPEVLQEFRSFIKDSKKKKFKITITTTYSQITADTNATNV